MTIREVAEEMGVSYQAVLVWCRKGTGPTRLKLPATNIAPEGSSRARWEIDREALETFRAARAS